MIKIHHPSTNKKKKAKYLQKEIQVTSQASHQSMQYPVYP